MKYRWKLLILLLVLSLTPMLCGRIFGVKAFKKHEQIITEHAMKTRTDEVEARLHLLAGIYSQILYQGRQMAETAVALQAKEMERILSTPSHIAPENILMSVKIDPSRGTYKKTEKTDLHFRTTSSGKRQPIEVSVLSQSFTFSPHVEKARILDDISRLSSMTPIYMYISDQFKDSILWQSTTLIKGVKGTYPGHDKLSGYSDPHKCPWYQTALKTDACVWSAPHRDPVTGQVVISVLKRLKNPEGRIIGVTKITVPGNTFFNKNFLNKNIPWGTQSFLATINYDPDNGNRQIEVIAKGRYDNLDSGDWKDFIRAKTLRSHDRKGLKALMDKMGTNRSGMHRLSYEKRDCLWVYDRADNWTFFILIAPYEAIVAPAEKAKKSIHELIEKMIRFTGIAMLILTGIVIITALIFSRTVTKPLKILVDGAVRLACGDFNTRIKIRSKDEFGEVGKVFNQVIPKLQEHYEMSTALALAREVQENLLPKSAPDLNGFDIYGTSISCDEVGGDYYDFIESGSPDDRRVVIVTGDVSGHGISSALLMATARALIRQRTATGGDMAHIVSDVNRQICLDVETSGSFMTLFYSEINPAKKLISWIRAGHDPAIVYDPAIDSFKELSGSGMSLGIFEDAEYKESTCPLSKGQVILLSTDGSWEMCNPRGEMFGKKRLKELIRSCAHQNAKDTVENIITALDRFREIPDREDDVTLVVIRVL